MRGVLPRGVRSWPCTRPSPDQYTNCKRRHQSFFLTCTHSHLCVGTPSSALAKHMSIMQPPLLNDLPVKASIKPQCATTMILRSALPSIQCLRDLPKRQRAPISAPHSAFEVGKISKKVKLPLRRLEISSSKKSNQTFSLGERETSGTFTNAVVIAIMFICRLTSPASSFPRRPGSSLAPSPTTPPPPRDVNPRSASAWRRRMAYFQHETIGWHKLRAHVTRIHALGSRRRPLRKKTAPNHTAMVPMLSN